MNKPLIKRTHVQTVTFNSAIEQKVLVEGDEAYVAVMINNTNSVLISRHNERRIKAAIAESGLTCTNPSLSEFVNVAYASGVVSLDTPNVLGELQNLQITTTAGATAITERIRNAQVGIKEYITMKPSNATWPLNVMIITVSYVPADVIPA
jgi:hypothetical protein